MATEIKRHLNPIDFMMMDVHRELDEKDVHPQAMLDKSAGPQPEEHSEEAGVGVSYPYERPLPDNVTTLDVETSHDLPTEQILRNAFEAKLTELVVCGIDEDGNEWVIHNITDPAISAWHLQRAIHILNLRHDRRMMEKHGTPLDDHPNPSA